MTKIGILVFGITIFLPVTAIADEILLFGGQNNDVFLGCFNCDQYNSQSIHNKFGQHGSEYSTDSIFNRFGQYGGNYSQYSPCNKFSNNGPVLVERNGGYYGRLTTNRYAPDAISDNKIVAWLSDICR